MKKALFIVLFLTFIQNAYSQNEFLFGNYQWGTTLDIIEMNEGTPDSEYYDRKTDENSKVIVFRKGIFYNNRLFEGYPVRFNYYFSENKLDHGTYVFPDYYTLERCTEIFIDLYNKLYSLYGGTDEQDELIIEKIKKNYSETIGYETRVDDGFFVFPCFYQISWFYENTQILMAITYNNIDTLAIDVSCFLNKIKEKN